MPPTSVHFNGSVNLSDAETVMREIRSRIPTGVRRMTDGETGERGYWILFQISRFMQMPELEPVAVGQAYESADDAPQMPQLKLRDGVSAEAIAWPDLGYAAAYAESFATFERLQSEGVIPEGMRLQLQYPTPIASMAGTIHPDDLEAVAASYERALFADVERALSTLPHDRIALQWDVAVEFGMLEGVMGPAQATLEQVTPPLTRCVDLIATDVPVGLHLCYGDYGHQHFKQPESLRTQVDLVNAVTKQAARSIDFISFTVPQGRGDEEFFAPLRELKCGEDTELYFGLVPYQPDEQPAGTPVRQSEHIDAALKASPAGARVWGICTECGLGRVESQDVPRLLDLHRELLSV